MVIGCPRCGAEATSGVYCQNCNDMLQAELEAADVLDFAMQWCMEYFKIKPSLRPQVRTSLADMPLEEATEYRVKVFIPEPTQEISLSIGEEAGGYTLVQWTVEKRI